MEGLFKPVSRSDGLRFGSVSEAARFMGGKAQGNHISRAAKVVGAKAYGFEWSIDGVDKIDANVAGFERGVKTSGKPVKRSDGVRFNSLSEAAYFMQKETNKPIQVNHISRAARVLGSVAYGYEWEFTDGDDVRHPIALHQGSGGMKVFTSHDDVMKWVTKNVDPSARLINILQCCNGRVDTAYGLKWSFIYMDDDD